VSWLNQKIFKHAIAVSLVSCLIGGLVSLVLFSSGVFVPNSLAFAANKSKLEIISDRLDQLQPFIDENNWITIDTYIHGPLGQVRTDIGSAVRLLKDPTKAKTLSNKFFDDLIKLDVAAGKRDIDQTVEVYERTRQDFSELVAVLKKF